ncbi:MAG: Gfo/Idh/MocA family oxidoreductase [Methylovulum sp.]|nr:Gfo/Idh/MocA family oxidoreductase [Methylovulum sp.]
MATKIRLGLIGLGNQGQEYLRAMDCCRHTEIVAGYDLSQAALDKTRREYPDLILAQCLGQLKALHLDGLVAALPHHCYEGIWAELLDFNCPILKEKPLGRTIREAQQFISAAKQQGCPIQTAIQRRQHPSYICLAERLKGQSIRELSVHMHLGFNPDTGASDSWRSQRPTAGGGALLDSGYHLVDLVHFLMGQFELVNACLWDGEKLIQAESDTVETEAVLLGRQGSAWVRIESKLSGEKCADSKTGYKKSEAADVLTTENRYFANREGVWENGELILACERGWEKAIAKQLDDFADNITDKRWNSRIIWEQLPAMQMIDRAYGLVYTA